ncbi:fimbrial protein [Serratia marcescens]|uniref:fimbrial protein n=1 Tax=Serratia nematodiphila TaxID=458197 RepID=UPI0011D368C3|nr:fimbrial protein [Serratia nematodiphila]MBH2773381.1 fimbrial protein [Serratia marcescens]TXE66665.1 fimbrial protein [Serratia nematodiphila]HCD1613295.1 fimbrial protein [Serratia marcescens]
MTEVDAMETLWRARLQTGAEYLRLGCGLAATATAASALTLLAVLLIGQPAQAATVGVTVKGVVIAKPKCEINGGNDIDVPFGELKIADIDGVNYGKKKIPYRVVCHGDTSGMNGFMKIKLQGTSPNFGDGLLRTDKDNLAIKLLFQNTQPLKLNEWLNFYYPNQPELHAVPIKSSGATLRGGDFSGSATLLVEVQ